MAQTKRKRRSKHRGNAAGVVEARGRTGRRLTPEEQKSTSRQSARDIRMSKPPTWKSAFLKAALMAGLLFLFTRIGVLGQNATLQGSIGICIAALFLYTPIAYMTDKFVYNRYQRRKQQQQQKKS